MIPVSSRYFSHYDIKFLRKYMKLIKRIGLLGAGMYEFNLRLKNRSAFHRQTIW